MASIATPPWWTAASFENRRYRMRVILRVSPSWISSRTVPRVSGPAAQGDVATMLDRALYSELTF